jgi:hypothetical protein
MMARFAFRESPAAHLIKPSARVFATCLNPSVHASQLWTCLDP